MPNILMGTQIRRCVLASIAAASLILGGCAGGMEKFMEKLRFLKHGGENTEEAQQAGPEGDGQDGLDGAGGRLAKEESERRKLRLAQRNLQRSLNKEIAAKRQLEGELVKRDLLLLEKEAQTADLSKQLEQAIAEVVRAKAKLRNLGSKAEAASTLAEAEIALKTMMDSMPKGKDNPQSLRAEELLKQAAQEFKTENYGGALYLTGQAKGILLEGRARRMSQRKASLLPGEIAFDSPVPLKTRTDTNLRSAPGLQSKIVKKLTGGATLTGHSYQGQWIRVRVEDGRQGWVFYKLVDIR